MARLASFKDCEGSAHCKLRETLRIASEATCIVIKEPKLVASNLQAKRLSIAGRFHSQPGFDQKVGVMAGKFREKGYHQNIRSMYFGVQIGSEGSSHSQNQQKQSAALSIGQRIYPGDSDPYPSREEGVR